jgi:hypothetical protein
VVAVSLALGAGAVFEVAYEIGRLISAGSAKEKSPILAWSGVMTGMALLYVTGLLIK